MKKTLVYITPHLSTGGLPQYLFKQIETMQHDMNIYCIEWEDITGGVFIVQRNRIKQLLGDNLITLSSDKHQLFSILDMIKPDVIHLQEIPELFMSGDVADKLYSQNRTYSIIETSHDSGYNVNNKVYLPDKFLMVSEYQKTLYKKFDVPCDVVEYPIENKVRTKTREEALRDLGLDPTLKHVINVGLFTPRKNQAEIIEYARTLQNYPIQFHFIGNQADNFKFYWESLMKNLPSNCKWWGERTDVDSFYEAADLFLFTSRGHSTDMETMPLVIREALSWKVPSLIYNLPVYMGYFDKYDTIEYLTEDMQKNGYRIAEKLLRDSNNLPAITKKMTPKFWSKWDLNTQTVHYGTDISIDYSVLVSLKEYKSDTVMWSTVIDNMVAGIEYWMIPVPKHVFSFDTDPHFMGIKLCIYDNKTGKQLYEEPYIHNFVDIPTISLSNSVPYRFNYLEYFIDKKYGKWLDRPYDLVIDVGANVGVFTSYMMYNDYAKKVVSIECSELVLTELRKNFKNNTNVTIISKALHTSTDPIVFYNSPENPVISSTLSPDKLVSHGAGVKGNVAVTVETITIKELVTTYKIIDLLKIDIEGGEYDVLLNTDELLFDSINNLIVECHFFEHDYQIKYNALLDKLRTVGYTVEEYEIGQSNYPGKSECIFAYKSLV
jgi:FkbM family methyltransferase